MRWWIVSTVEVLAKKWLAGMHGVQQVVFYVMKRRSVLGTLFVRMYKLSPTYSAATPFFRVNVGILYEYLDSRAGYELARSMGLWVIYEDKSFQDQEWYSYPFVTNSLYDFFVR